MLIKMAVSSVSFSSIVEVSMQEAISCFALLLCNYADPC
jgi:hypothetical protein